MEEEKANVDASDITANDREVIQKLKEIFRELNGTGEGKVFSQYSAIELSSINGNIAAYKESLGEMFSRAQRNVSIWEAYLKLRKVNEKDRLTVSLKEEAPDHKAPSVSKVNSEIEKLMFRDRLKLAFKEEFKEYVLYLWRTCNDYIGIITTRIRVLESHRADIHILDDGIQSLPDVQDYE